jgi:SAM-dependent methyltransferase
VNDGAAGAVEESSLSDQPTVVLDPKRPDLGGNVRHGDAWTYHPSLWRFLVGRFAVQSVLDVGCGEGHAVRFFHSLGTIAHGIDGLRLNVLRAVYPIALHDLLSGPYLMPVDLVWSCEVAEHIHEEHVAHYLDTLANGKVVAMTHAVPGQGGHHHVNCQPAEYWIERMAQRHYRLDPAVATYRHIAAGDPTNFFQQTGLVFLRE